MDALKSKGQMYDQIDLGKIQKSGFDLSFDCKGTGSLGRLYPVRCMETLPGDKFQGSTQISAQFNPLAVPMLSNMFMRTETFYVPNRLLWKDWEKFISGGQKLDDTSSVPMISFYDCLASLIDPDELPSLFTLKPLQVLSYVGDYDCQYNSDSFMGTVKPVADYQFFDHYVENGTPRGYSGQGDYNMVVNCKCYRWTTVVSCNSLIESIMALRDVLINKSKSAGIYDLMLDSVAALESAITYLKNIPDVTYFYRELSQSISSGEKFLPIFDVSDDHVYDYTRLRAVNSLGSSYLDKILPYLRSEYMAMMINAKTHDNVGIVQYRQPVYLATFSDEYIAFMRYLYDCFRPFVGLGSNLEMLGYHIFDFSDLLAMQYRYIASEVALSVMVSGDYESVCFSVGFEYVIDSWFNYLEQNSAASVVSVLPLRALYAIWYNYYRDQVLESDALEPVTDSSVTSAELLQLLAPRRRCWAKDTFTTALDNTGTGSVIVPVNDSTRAATFVLKDFASLTKNTTDTKSAKIEDIDVVRYTLSSGESVELPSRYLGAHAIGPDTDKGTSGFSLDVMKRAERVQKWIQKALIYGNRPQDFLFTHFGVRSSDARLQLPEFLSSDSKLCRLDTLINNTTTAESVVGDKAANAYGYTDGSNLNRFCEEHGLIITLFSIMPETDYGYGVSRLLRRNSKFDFAFPEFATLGMDGVLNYELCETPVKLTKKTVPESDYEQPDVNSVFGYQGRYYDYKCKLNEIHGDLRDSLKMYTFAREFNPYDDDGMPKLNKYFVHCRPRLDMFVSDYPLDDQFRFDIHHSQAVERCLPVPSQYL